MDKFKDFVEKNRDEMDLETPPFVLKNVLKEIEAKKSQQQNVTISKRYLALLIAVAACLIPAAMIISTMFKTEKAKEQSETPIAINEKKEGINIPSNLEIPNPKIKTDTKSIDANHQKTSLVSNINSQNVNSGFFIQAKDANSSANRYMAMKLPPKMQHIDKKILKILVNTLNTDPNTNVRLAALESLNTFISESYVKTQLIESFKIQTDPTIQIALINILTDARIKTIEAELDRMFESSETDIMLKSEILIAKQKLSL